MRRLLSRPGIWLILADGRGLGEALRTRLTSAGQRCVLARSGSSFVHEGNDQFALDPANPADFESLLKEVGVTAEMPLRGVLHLWSQDFPLFDAMTTEDLACSQLLGCGSALHLIQALSSLKTDSPPFVWLVTRGAQSGAGFIDTGPCGDGIVVRSGAGDRQRTSRTSLQVSGSGPTEHGR